MANGAIDLEVTDHALDAVALAVEALAYAYVKKDEEPIRSLHRAMNSKVQQGADFWRRVSLQAGEEAKARFVLPQHQRDGVLHVTASSLPAF